MASRRVPLGRMWLASLLALGLLTAGCGGARPAPAQPAQPAGGAPAAASTAPAGKTYEAKFALSVSLNDAAGKAATELAKNVKEKSNGQLEIKIFPNEQLGGEPDVVQGVKQGAIHMAFVSPGILGNLYADFQILNGPFLWSDWDTAKKVLSGPFGQQMAENFRKATGIRVLDPLWYWGWREMTANRPIRKPEDLRGLKMRSPNIPIFVAMFQALGSNPTTIDFNEIYTALQQGLIDGQENPIPAIWSKKFYEVNKVISLTHHILQSNLIVVNDAFYQSLPENLRSLLVAEVKKAGELNTRLQLEMEQGLRDQMKAKGVTFIDDVDREAFRKRTEVVYDQFKDKWSPDLYKRFRAAIEGAK